MKDDQEVLIESFRNLVDSAQKYLTSRMLFEQGHLDLTEEEVLRRAQDVQDAAEEFTVKGTKGMDSGDEI